MATILLSGLGAAVGSGFGGAVLGLSGAVIGRAVGATVGRAIDQRLMGLGSEAVEVGRLDRLYLTGAGEGAAVARVWGRMRVAGQVIWASPYRALRQASGGGKGAAPRSTTVSYSYSVSLAIALGQGVMGGVGRIWADGNEIAPSSLDLRFYAGDEAQEPDPVIEAVEGAGMAPAYRGTAYVVIENLDLSPFGNRVPQFTFEVVRGAGVADADAPDLADAVRGVALIPGTGEYALATSVVKADRGLARQVAINANTASGAADFSTALGQLRRELPRAKAVSLVVSWFGDDLRCGSCTVRPKVEQVAGGTPSMPWRAGGIERAAAQVLPSAEGRAIYGGTPADASVLEAIAAMKAGGQEVMFYPFVLMTQLAGNGLPDPYGGAEQAVLPWRGRITTSVAVGRAGSPDGTAVAEPQVAAFFGAVQAGHFALTSGRVVYSGPAGDWGYRRFILHYAWLCKLAGGVESFCIGSELRGLTWIKGAGGSFPAVAAFGALAADVRAILGPSVKIGYAADWSEYFGRHLGGDVDFHLDPLWADVNIDFVGIDNYMPLSDWRDGTGHADAHWGAVHDLGYLRAGIAGGEGFDWFYDGPEAWAAQNRKPITDGAYGEDWVYRVKDLAGWWGNYHHNRAGGVKAALPTAWVPGAKPIRFTEYGCPAVDKGTNEPNRFVDPKSSESGLPRASSGERDDLIQMQYIRAMAAHWTDPASNPAATAYAGRMVDWDHSYAWAWDARPFPAFPRNEALWGDGGSFRLGHWLNGRASAVPLDLLLAGICDAAGVGGVDTSAVYGAVAGYAVQDVASARAAIQPLAQVYGYDAVEGEGVLRFISRGVRPALAVVDDGRALDAEMGDALEITRSAEAEVFGRVRLGFVESEGDYEARVAEAADPAADAALAVTQAEFAMALPAGFAKAVAERWLAEADAARDQVAMRLPPSRADVRAGEVIAYRGQSWRVDRVELTEARGVEAVRVEPALYAVREAEASRGTWVPYVAPPPVTALWLDIPRGGGATGAAPLVAVTSDPWAGEAALWSSETVEGGYRLHRMFDAPAIIGLTETDLHAARAGRFDRGPALRVNLVSGALEGVSLSALLSGRNAMAIGDGSAGNWEVFQFQLATLVAPDTYDLGLRLRGQLGTDAVMPAVWPVGSYVVLLDEAVVDSGLPDSYRGLERVYRVGRASLGASDPDASVVTMAYAGHALRPLRVAHLRVCKAGADWAISWIRRTRQGGDSWEVPEVPLAEEAERYLLRVRDGADVVVRTVDLTAPAFTYTAAMRTADGAAGVFTVEVAQVSATYGLGPFRHVEAG